ncbi:MAG: hypothetical protein AMS21_05745 [Gemmatimonas sp. SG8_38_2]|nr:MAG: hypothetical protein AMS21_05745 [Gemmatimonas sp. SG8_38_2]
MPGTIAQAQAPPRGRLIAGGAVFVAGFAAPALVPIVLASGLPAEWKTGLSGLLMLGIPELAMLIAVAILGKEGFEFLTGGIKRGLGKFFERYGPAERVSRARYRVGLAMFGLPILLGWVAPYLGHHLPGYAANELVYAVVGDLLLFSSLFVLGGEFWDKLRSLFVHRARAVFS